MDYNNGKIYTIRSPTTDKYYIGSTTQALRVRLAKHNNDAKHKPFFVHKHLYKQKMQKS